MKIWHGVFRLCVSSPRGTEAICDRSRTPISIKMQRWGEYLLHELTMLNINITAYGISKLPHMRMRASEKAEGASSASAARVGGILPPTGRYGDRSDMYLDSILPSTIQTRMNIRVCR